MRRGHQWLIKTLAWIWADHFADVKRLNVVSIEWSRHNRHRLGAISLKATAAGDSRVSQIHLHSLLRHTAIPETVVVQTIAHELVHYAHGFCSPHHQKYRYPHQGGVVRRELAARGLAEVYNEAEAWLKKNWLGHVDDTLGPPKRRSHKLAHPQPFKLSFLSHRQPRSASRHRVGKR